jgi:radical SAM superfamily enzyme YgiQ (UPF0313 family)
MSEWQGRVVLVNPPLAVAQNYYLAPPLGLLLVARALRDRGHDDVRVIDLALEFAEGQLPAGRDLPHDAAEALAAKDAATFGFSVQCVTLPLVLAIAKCLRRLRPKARIVLGGHQATLLASEIVQRFSFIDEVIAGPGEDAIDAKVLAAPWRFPDYDAGPSLDRYAEVSVQATALVETARGCPFDCSFCSIPLALGRKVRYKPLELVAAEMKYLLSRGCREFHFVDDTFTLKAGHVRNLLWMLRNLEQKISWSAMTRVDMVTPRLLKEMGQNGCHSILYGVEASDARTLRSLNKRAERYPDFAEFLSWHVDAGIAPSLYFLINLPGQSINEVRNNLTTAARLSVLDPGACRLNLPRLVPGTRMARQAQGRLAFDVNAPYADAMLQTVGENATEVWDFAANNPDLCSTYFRAQGPLNNFTANAVGWLGSRLLSMFPLTLAALAEDNLLVDLFETLGSLRQAREWSKTTEIELCELVGSFVEKRSPALMRALLFEDWKRKAPESAFPYFTSDVDQYGAMAAARKSGERIAARLYGPKVLYRCSNMSHDEKNN